jgi:hypothetical protein
VTLRFKDGSVDARVEGRGEAKVERPAAKTYAGAKPDQPSLL